MHHKWNPELRRKHAKERAVQRYGIELTKKARRELILMIQQGKVQKRVHISNSRIINQVEYQGQPLVLVYSRTTKDIVTMLPLDCRELKEKETEPCENAQ